METDYISRDAALECFFDWYDRCGNFHEANEHMEYRAIERLPAADVRPVRLCDGCPFCVCEKYGVICPSDPDFRCPTMGGTP